MEIFINELSLNEQYSNENDFTKAIIEFTAIVSLLKKEVRQSEFFKYSNFIYNRKAVYNQNFLASIARIKDKTIKISFKDIVFNKTNPKDWRNEKYHKETDDFYCKSLEKNVNNTSLAEISERKILFNKRTFILLNFIFSDFRNINNVELIKNKKDKVLIDSIDTKEKAIKWLNVHYYEELILKDKKRFKPTNRISYKCETQIYVEIETKYYWYFDNFHKTHFEVFDRTKKHIGEANLKGELDTSKRDASKDGKIEI